MGNNPHVLEDEAEPQTLSDLLRPAEYGVMPQRREELRQLFDPYGDREADLLLENY